MADKTRSRRLREKRKHLGSWAILLVVLAVFAVSTIGGIRLRQRNRSYEAREEALQEAFGAYADYDVYLGEGYTAEYSGELAD